MQPLTGIDLRRKRLRDALLAVFVIAGVAAGLGAIGAPPWAVTVATATAGAIAVFGTRRIIIETIDSSSLDATLWCDDVGRIIGWNEAATFALGWTQSEVKGADVFERVFTDHDLNDARRLVTQLGDRPRRVRRFFLARNGEQVFLEAELSRVLAGGFRMTLRKAPTQTLPPDYVPGLNRTAAPSTRRSSHVTVLPHLAVELDSKGRVIRVAEGAHDALPELGTGAFMANALGPTDGPRLRTILDEVASTGLAAAFDAAPDAAFGCWIALPRQQPAVKALVIGLRRGSLLLEGVSARNAASERVKDDFLATISHEIRTPLNGVIGMSEMLKSEVTEPEQKDAVQTIRTSAEALLKIVNDILSFSSSDRGRAQIETVTFNPRQILEDAIELVAARSAGKDLEIGYEADEHLPVALLGDAGRVRQVLLNLIDNAVKFTAAGSVIVRLDVERPAEPENTAIAKGDDESRPKVGLRISVTDTGDGIAPHVLPRLFQPFSQGDNSVRRRYGGTGLGLAICRRIIEQMGGTIDVDAAWRGGARLLVAIPFGLVEAAEAGPPPYSGLVALAIDPDPTSGRLIAARLAALGFQPAVIHPGDDPGGASTRTPSLLVFNMHMLEAGEAERAGHWCRKYPGVPALLIGQAHQRTGDAVARALAPSGYLTKPVREESLRRRLAAIMPVAERAGPQVARAEVAHSTIQMKAMTLEAQRPRVLVAEDNPVNQMVARKLLERLGCEVHIAADGREAVETSKLFAFDMVFMDCQMPHLDGFEATRRIRAYEGKAPAKRLPIIAMTANVMPGIVDSCREAGMDDYLSKPINQGVLLAALQRWGPHLHFQPQ